MGDPTMAGRWMLTRIDGEPIGGEFTWVDGMDGDEPDWVWFDDTWEPVEVLAERFMPALTPSRYHRQSRRRWFGLTEHEWEFIDPESWDEDDPARCVNCEISEQDAIAEPAPWNYHCRIWEECDV